MTKIHHYDAINWHVPTSDAAKLDLDTPPPDGDPGRKFLAQGEGGFYTQVVRMPAGFAAPVHAHDHSEVFMVLEGSCTFDDEPMTRFDLAVVEADQPYSFTAGPDGLSFLVVRQGRAAYSDTDTNAEATS